MSMEEQAARRVYLAQAIEAGDSQGKLLSQVERDQIDAQARQDALLGSTGEHAIRAERFFDLRAQRVLQAVEGRNPAIAALQQPGPWQRWASIGLPLLSVALGVLTDVIANPHRVDLVSLPLLAIVGWNVLMYLALAGGWLLWRGRRPGALAEAQHRRADSMLRWRRGSGQVRAEITALFHLRWQRATQALTVQRWKRILHLAAAGWAVGIALSLLTRGLVVEYRVGWESTFLDAAQVHAILSLLRLPALLLFPFQSFTAQEVAALQFSQGGGAAGGARWVLMYVALLLVVVVVPRFALAIAAFWRERALARRVRIEVGEPYFQRLVSLLSVARVHLCLVAHRPEERAAALRVLAQGPDQSGLLMTSSHGDVLRLLELSGAQPPPTGIGRAPGAGWMQRLRHWLLVCRRHASVDPALSAAKELADVMLHVAGEPGDLPAAAALLRWLGKPVLVLVDRRSGAPASEPGLVTRCRAEAREQPLVAQVLSFDDFARCWVQERVLLEAVARCVPDLSRPGFERIAAAWDERNATRFGRSMAAIADHLLFAARQVQEVASGALTVRSLAASERQAQANARQAAMDEVVKRLEVSAGEMFSRLRVLHGLEVTEAVALQHRLQEKFVVQQSVDRPQAGMAGAATGAAMGASVDLLVGGLTLGAAAALGALVGGSAAYMAAAWKNRSTPGGSTVVHLSDEMLQAIAEAALLRYLAVAHHGRWAAGLSDDLPPSWKADVVLAVEANRERLAPSWHMARTQTDTGKLVAPLARDLEGIARQVLDTLYPPRRAPA